MIKDLLAIVETGPACAPAIDAAILFAEQVGAHLGITAVTERVLLLAAFDPMGQCWPEESREEEHRAGLETIRRQVAIATVPVDVHGLCEEPAVLPGLADVQALYTDLVMVGAVDGWSDPRLRRRVIETALLGAGAPVLVHPQGWAPAPFDRITLGWDGSQQAARAARELRHVARPGAVIDVLIVDAAAPRARCDPGCDIACHLARHGFTTRVYEVTSDGRTTADVIQNFARDQRAQLLVLGAYAHARLRETVFGGVTRQAIDHPEIATLLVH